MKHSPGFLKLVADAKKRVKEIRVADVKRTLRKNPVIFIDIREDHEWEAGHAAGAIHLGKGIIEREIERVVPDKGSEVILYCGGGYRSALAGDNLRKMGYTNVLSMAGGWKAWKRSGGKVKRG